jgi:hypothetical protein
VLKLIADAAAAPAAPGAGQRADDTPLFDAYSQAVVRTVKRAGCQPRDIIVRIGETTVVGVDDPQRLLTDELIWRSTDVVVPRAGALGTLSVVEEGLRPPARR